MQQANLTMFLNPYKNFTFQTFSNTLCVHHLLQMSFTNIPQFDHQIKRFVANFKNTTSQDTLAEAVQKHSVPFLEDATKYKAIVESCTLDLSGMVLNSNPDFKILIMNNDKTGKYPGLPLPDNIFTLNTEIREVEEVLSWLYYVFHKTALPDDLGHFDLTEDGLFTFTLKDDSPYRSGDIAVYFNDNLYNILSEFCDDGTARINGIQWYKLDDQQTTTAKTQRRYTLSRLLSAVSIYFFTDLPVTPTLITNTELGTATPERIIASLTLNRETFDIVNKYSMVYSPTQFKPVTMSTPTSVQDFKVWIKIHYKNDRYIFHVMKPGDYSILNIAFTPREELLLG